MKKELNIAAILKDKPVNTHLYDVARNVTLLFQKIDEHENIICSLIDGLILKYTNTGSMYQYPTGMEVLKPSEGMQEWSKFVWKKGDVLRFSDILVIFEKWTTDNYTEFKASYEYNCHSGSFDKGNVYYTSEFCKAIDEVADNFIKNIEEHYGGKLNLSTLQIEQPKQEFKDGDVLFVKISDNEEVFIKKLNPKEKTAYYVSYNLTLKDFGCQWCKAVCREQNIKELRLATDSEKQQLFSALEKIGKAWNAENKMLVDLPKKCGFEPFDKCVWKIQGIEGYIWQASFISYVDGYDAVPIGVHVDADLANLIVLPYNDQTKHLLGTTDEWKGGEG